VKGSKNEVKSIVGDAMLKWRRSEHRLMEPVLALKKGAERRSGRCRLFSVRLVHLV
jgi:hypothetical protein